MKIIVGLGNPGKEYEKTRHNCGFMVLEKYAKDKKLDFKKKFNGEYCEYIVENEKILLVKPQTYMNLSGNCVIKYMKYFNIDMNDLLIIYDDMDFELGQYKIKKRGSSAGHNGIKSIIDSLGTEEISRIRIGISRTASNSKNYVLGKLNKKQTEVMSDVIDSICKIIDDYANNMDIDKLMEKYN